MWTRENTKELRDFGIQILTVGSLTANQAEKLSKLIAEVCEQKDLNKSVILNCKNHGKDGCNFNGSGDCKLSHVSFAKVGSLIKSHMICEDFEPIPDEDDS